MSILTKPSVQKGVAAQFSLNKGELLQHSAVQSDSYFSNSQNWYRVNVIYKSSPGGQYEIVEFDATQQSPVASFLVSEKARDFFQVQKIQILDFDGGFLEIMRNQLVVEGLDVSISAQPTVTYVSWDLTNGPTTNSSGAVISNAGSLDWFYMMKSSNGFSGDFSVTFAFDSSNVSALGMGISSTTILGNFNNSYVMFKGSGEFFEFTSDAGASYTGNYTYVTGYNTMTFERVGNTVSIKINGTVVHTFYSSEVLYPVARPFYGEVTSTVIG